MRKETLGNQRQLDLFVQDAMQVPLPKANKHELISALADLVLDCAEKMLGEKEMPNERKDND